MSCFDGVHEENPSVSGLSEPTASTFKHTPLQDPQQSLCLSTFERLAPDGSLGFHLNTFPFISSLIYNAVSYECGSPDDKLTIFVNGMPFLIYRNLHIFLSQLQAHGFDDTPIFADAISIDQTDIPERNAQVQMMGRIYKQAQTVMIWLGPAADGSDLVFNSLNSEGHALEELTGDDESPEKYAGDGSEYPALNSQSAAKSMVAVFKRTYWYRLMGYPRNCSLLDGRSSVAAHVLQRL